MTLSVHTARLGGQPPDPDDLDITRAGADAYRRLHRLPAGVLAPGEAWAPSWSILNPALAARRLGGEAFEEAWQVYIPAFLDEMRASWRVHRKAWDALLDRPRVVLRCCRQCTNPARCHRVLVAERCLAPLGAAYMGELPVPRRQGRLPWLE